MKYPKLMEAIEVEATMGHLLAYAIVSLFYSVSSAAFDLIPEHNFVTCVAYQSPQYSAIISKLVYSPHSPSFSSIFLSSIKKTSGSSSTAPKIISFNTSLYRIALITSKLQSFVAKYMACKSGFEAVVTTMRGSLIIHMSLLSSLILSTLIMLELTATMELHGFKLVPVGELYYHVANQSKGHGFPAGVCPSMGAGGQGTLMRKFGLAAYNVVDATVVTADGNIFDRQGMGEDFFWAIRGGGGGNFGVVVEWKINLVPVPPKVTVLNISRTLEQNATKLIHRWQQIAHKFHEDLFIRIIIFVGRDSKDGKTIQANFNSLFLGTTDLLVPLMARSFPELGLKPEDCKEISWIQSTIYSNGENPGQALESLLDRNHVQKGFFKGKSDFVTEPISETNLEAIWRVMQEGEAGIMVWDPYGGKMSEISKSSIPFPHRAGVLHNIQYFNKWQKGEYLAEQRHLKWINRLYNFMAPFVTKNPRTAYVNYRDMDIGRNIHGRFSEAKVWGEKYFKGNFDKLAHIKGRVDYGNFFKNEQSIAPNFYL